MASGGPEDLEEYEAKVEEALHPRRKRRQRYRHQEGRERTRRRSGK